MADEGLVQFLVLAKAAKGAACVALIQQVLSNKKIFVFGELLAMPNVQAVSKAFSIFASSCTARERKRPSALALAVALILPWPEGYRRSSSPEQLVTGVEDLAILGALYLHPCDVSKSMGQ